MGEREFDERFAGLFGERWPGLRAALLEPGDSVDFGDGLLEPYRLDSASVVAAKALRLPESGEILDACAAPGGKSLVIGSRMGQGTRMLCNELSSDRRRRLSDVLDRHLSPGTRSRVTVSGFDAAAAGGRVCERGRFAAILLDAPCSSERHVLKDASALGAWMPARIKFLSRRQWSLLSSAFLLLAPGGSLVYATCALSPEENDSPVRRLFEKYGDDALLDPLPDADGAERTVYGVHYLPDRAAGAGPLYVARVTKRPTAG
ncbi:MAG: 16S rRNA methyltransferase [Spirochaetae bacterium HGW-Spirochaetae-3]|jgi:16S rRNA (cytosine1407-C5)-methyltransferase|nr:MAG: 16S rRNA methyltransferase [Spirochaetae bacterium HGW-Spirochaetae-3]